MKQQTKNQNKNKKKKRVKSLDAKRELSKKKNIKNKKIQISKVHKKK